MKNYFKKTLAASLAMLAVAGSVPALTNGGTDIFGASVTASAAVAVTGVSLDKATLALKTGESDTLTPTVTPTDADNKTVTWASDAPAVASVDAAGKVTALKAGTAKITVITVDGNFTAVCTVTVTEAAHDWSEPTYVWAADLSAVTATRVCKTDPTHVETETVATTSKVIKTATATTPGETAYTAVFVNPAFAAQTRTVTDIPKVTSYTVSFVNAGSTAVPSQFVESGKTASAPYVPARQGYTFRYWALNGTQYDFSTPVTSDITLTAVWDVSSSSSSTPYSYGYYNPYYYDYDYYYLYYGNPYIYSNPYYYYYDYSYVYPYTYSYSYPYYYYYGNYGYRYYNLIDPVVTKKDTILSTQAVPESPTKPASKVAKGEISPDDVMEIITVDG